MNQRLLLLAIAGLAFLWATNRWRKATEAVLVLLVLEGAIRKWLFPGSQQLVYFFKDVLLLGCYVGYLRAGAYRRAPVQIPPALGILLLLGAAWTAIEMFNPNLPSLAVGILGFKSYFLYVPLLFLIPACYDDDRALGRFLSRYVLLVIPVCLLGLIQFRSGAGSTLNVYARSATDELAAITFGSSQHVRVTGTFAFITGYTSYLVAMAVLLLALLASSGWRFHSQRKLHIALALSLLGMLMSGSRGPIFTLLLLFPFYWYLGVLRERDMSSTMARGVLAIGVLLAALASFGGEALGAFLGRASGSTDVVSRTILPITTPYLLLPEVGLFGLGAGATHQAASAVAPSIVPYAWLRGLHVEVETGRVMIELGPLGFLLTYAPRLLLAAIAFGYAKTLRTRFHRSLALASFLFLFGQMVSTVFDVTSGVYYWFFAGLMMLAVRLDRLAVEAHAHAAASRGVLPARPPAASLAPAPTWRAPLARRS